MNYEEFKSLPDNLKALLSKKYDQAARDRKVIAMYNKGRTLRFVADKFDLSHEGVRKILLRNGYGLRNVGPHKESS